MARPFLDPVARIEAKPVDFVQIMVDLYNAGCNAGMVSRHIGCSPSAAYEWGRGRTEPKYNYGASLLLLREKYCRR